MKKPTFHQVPFTNNLGQVIELGKKCVFITCSTHKVAAREGVYVGYLTRGDVKSVQLYCMKLHWVWYYKGTDEIVDWSKFDRNNPVAVDSRLDGKVGYIVTLRKNLIFPKCA